MTSPASTAKAVAPLVVVNALAVYGQLAYAMDSIAPHDWPLAARVALAVGFAAAVESVALYVQWHAHDALILKSHGTARSLRRWSFLIAACVAAMNYSHFAERDLSPTAAACAFGLLSLLSPWMWGLHTRRAARLQLLKERRADEAGAEFSSERRRAFPIRTWQARRWSIDHGVTDPIEAWNGFKAERAAMVKVGKTAEDLAPAVVPSVPVRRVRALPSAPVSGGGRMAAWDVERAVDMILHGKADVDIMAETGVSPKNLQRTRRIVRDVTNGQPDADIKARMGLSLDHIGRVRAAMEAKA